MEFVKVMSETPEDLMQSLKEFGHLRRIHGGRRPCEDVRGRS